MSDTAPAKERGGRERHGPIELPRCVDCGERIEPSPLAQPTAHFHDGSDGPSEVELAPYVPDDTDELREAARLLKEWELNGGDGPCDARDILAALLNNRGREG